MTLANTEMNVQGAFELLIESLEEEVNGINHLGSEAFERGDYPAVDTMRLRVEAITALREKVLALRNEWESIVPPPKNESAKENCEPVGQDNIAPLKSMPTTDRELKTPYLQAPISLGSNEIIKPIVDNNGVINSRKLEEVKHQTVTNDSDIFSNYAEFRRFELSLDRLPKGKRTPTQAYEIPLLQALISFGGKSRLAAVIDKVGEIMASTLNEADHQSLPSDYDIIRWRNNVSWTRYHLIEKGDMNCRSPRGIWEITEQGRQRVKDEK